MRQSSLLYGLTAEETTSAIQGYFGSLVRWTGQSRGRRSTEDKGHCQIEFTELNILSDCRRDENRGTAGVQVEPVLAYKQCSVARLIYLGTHPDR